MDDSLEGARAVDMPEDEDVIWQTYQDEKPNGDVGRMMAADEVP